MNIHSKGINPGDSGLSRGYIKGQSLPSSTEFITKDKVVISGGGADGGLKEAALKKAALKGKVIKTADPGVSASSVDGIPASNRELFVEIPFEKHMDQATVYILEKTAKQYPGFEKNVDGKSLKGVQIHFHLKDFVEFVKKEKRGDFASLPEKERKDIVRSASGFVADKIGEQYGMAPHMRRNPMLMSPILSNIGDYLEFLSKENIVLSSDNEGNMTVTKYMSREAALNVIGGSKDNSANAQTGDLSISRKGGWVVIGGVKLPVNK